MVVARRTWTRPELAQAILAGELLTVYRSRVLRLNGWLAGHPGGELALLHYVGRDATDEIDAYHSDETLASRLDRFCVGQLLLAEEADADVDADVDGEEGPFLSLVPPIMLGFTLATEPAAAAGAAGPTWVPLKGSLIALEAARAQRRAAAAAGGAPAAALAAKEKEEAKEEKKKAKENEATPPPPPSPASTTAAADAVEVSEKPTLELSDLFPPAAPAALGSPAVQRAHALAYRKLHAAIRAEGLYTPPGRLAGYGPDLVRYLLLAAGFVGCLVVGLGKEPATAGWARPAWLGGSAASLGFLWHQLTFVAHDSGHTSVLGKGDYLQNRLLGMVVANWIGGLSLGWWCDSHNIHHLVTNHVEHDPDIQHVPFFAIDPVFFTSVFSTYYDERKWFDGLARRLVPYQHKLYYLVLGLARFNLYALSYNFLFKQALDPKKRRKSRAGRRFWAFEVAGIAAFWAWFGWGVLGSLAGWREVVVFLLVSHVLAAPVHVQIVLSHFARSTADLGVLESFAHRQLRTTMDVICPPSIDFIHGGLDKQVTHHLFPRLPRHNLRRATALVKAFCEAQELEFAEYRFVEGNVRVLSVLQDVANQVQFIAQVAEAEAKGELSQGH